MTQLKGTEMRIGRDWSLDGRSNWSLDGRCGSRAVCGGRGGRNEVRAVRGGKRSNKDKKTNKKYCFTMS